MTAPTRKQRFKDLMRNRRTLEQGLTFKQIFNEVHSNVVEKYHKNKTPEFDFNNAYWQYDYEEWRVKYLKRMMKKIQKTDDDFRHLNYLYVNRIEADKNGKRVKPYLEYRWVNINATETPELLEAHKIDLKHTQRCLTGLKNLVKDYKN